MCGIVSYLGNRLAYPILIECLQYLEYRGYDSVGISIVQQDYGGSNELQTIKSIGKLNQLVSLIKEKAINLHGTVGIGHNRWATHGNVTIENAHPHISRDKSFALVHNGIVENYKTLKDILEKRGYTFTSQTDTETIVHLIDNIMRTEGDTLEIALRKTVKQIIGAYAIIITSKDEPNALLVAKNSSPLIIGFNSDYTEYIVASDIQCISKYVTNVIYLEDQHVAKLEKGRVPRIYNNLNNELITPFIENLQLEMQISDKHGYEHYLLKEIYEQPFSIINSIRGRINPDTFSVKLGGLYNSYNTIMNENTTFTFIGCGTSFNACLIAEYLFESLLKIPCKAINASEYKYKNPIIQKNEIVVAISQSGETADTLAAIKLAKKKGAYTLGICNVVSSSIARVTHCGCYIHAGPEISVASTKAFISQLCIIILMSLYIKPDIFLAAELYTISKKVQSVLDIQEVGIQKLAQKLYTAEHILFLGRGILYPVALESALKFKELTYIHAEGILTSEIKHGPLAMIDENMPIIVFANKCETYDKTISSIEEIKARGGNVYIIRTNTDTELIEDEYSISVPDVSEYFLPFISVIPIQLLAYHIALLRKTSIDTPRHIAKSVTVE